MYPERIRKAQGDKIDWPKDSLDASPPSSKQNEFLPFLLVPVDIEKFSL